MRHGVCKLTTDTLISILLVGGILLVSFIATQIFARAMYLTCPSCRTLNARRASRKLPGSKAPIPR